MFDFFRNLDKRKLIGLIVLVICLIILPLILLQVRQQQDLRQRAEGFNNVYLELRPSGNEANVINTQFVQTLYLQNPKNQDISAVDITLSYNVDNLDIVDFIAENNLSYIVKNISTPGEIHLVGINSRELRIVDSSIPLGAFILKAKKGGSGTINFSKITVTATSETQPLAINMSDNKLGSYTIEQKQLLITPTAFPTETPTPLTPTPETISFPTLSPTPTSGPLPYSYSIFPKEGPQGTIFTITVKTPTPLTSDSKLTVVFHMPADRKNNFIPHDSSDSYTDGLYNNIWTFDSSANKAQNVEINFTSIVGDKFTYFSDKDSFIIISGNTSDACIPITKKGDISKKIDIIVASNNYKQNELNDFKNKVLPKHINAIFSKDPFSLNKDKFNVWFVNQVNNEPCTINNGSECIKSLVYKSCPFFDKIIAIDKARSRSFTDWSNIVFNLGDDPMVTVHEFGHAMGRLADEYDISNDPTNLFRRTDSSGNCSVFACPNWCSGSSSLKEPSSNYPYDKNGSLNFGQSCQQNTACYYGCGGGLYRSSKNSIMNNLYAKDKEAQEFNAVSKKLIQEQIDAYTN